ncbi:MAG: hypothetical protein RIQ60_1159 [Pseudomonadota bacterium]|jgi:hypothetical protein
MATDMLINADHIGTLVLAVGGLGLAASALVDASKALPGGGVSRTGFEHIEKLVKLFLPDAKLNAQAPDLGQALLLTLKNNWVDGKPAADQRAVAKSLLKLQLSAENAAHFAQVCQVDATLLGEVAAAMKTGTPLESRSANLTELEKARREAQMNVLGRFDLALTALIDAAWHRADQRYRNVSKACAAGMAVMLALLGGWAVQGAPGAGLGIGQTLVHAMVGLLAVPMAPIAKDLASALQAGVKVMQTLKP